MTKNYEPYVQFAITFFVTKAKKGAYETSGLLSGDSYFFNSCPIPTQK
jgi:hypothetical protein